MSLNCHWNIIGGRPSLVWALLEGIARVLRISGRPRAGPQIKIPDVRTGFKLFGRHEWKIMKTLQAILGNVCKTIDDSLPEGRHTHTYTSFFCHVWFVAARGNPEHFLACARFLPHSGWLMRLPMAATGKSTRHRAALLEAVSANLLQTGSPCGYILLATHIQSALPGRLQAGRLQLFDLLYCCGFHNCLEDRLAVGYVLSVLHQQCVRHWCEGRFQQWCGAQRKHMIQGLFCQPSVHAVDWLACHKASDFVWHDGNPLERLKDRERNWQIVK